MRDSCKLRHPITVAANHSFSVYGVKNMNPLMELQGPIPLQKLMAREPHAWEELKTTYIRANTNGRRLNHFNVYNKASELHLHYVRLTGGIVDSDASYLTSYGGSILILGDPKLHVGEECGKDKGIPPTLVNATGVHFLGCKGADWESRDDEGKHPGDVYSSCRNRCAYAGGAIAAMGGTAAMTHARRMGL